MAKPRPDGISLIDLWCGALESDVGIAISTDDRNKLQQQLYRERQVAGIEALEQLTIVMPEKGDEVWICRKTADE